VLLTLVEETQSLLACDVFPLPVRISVVESNRASVLCQSGQVQAHALDAHSHAEIIVIGAVDALDLFRNQRFAKRLFGTG
jgi:hypothetical protein